MAPFQGVPSRRDPRWGQVAALTAFCILGQTVLNFEITPLEILLSVCTCVGTDMALTRIRRHQVIVPLSSLISGLGLGLLLRSTYPAVFVVAGIVAITSKHFITVHGRHRFNPTNFGLVVTLAFTQGGIAMVTPGQWGKSGLIIFAILGTGALVVFRAERLALVAMFVVSQVVFTMVFHGGHPDLATSLSGSVLAFAFFMITDPKTAPTSWRAQGIYAAGIALLGQIFAAWGSMDGLFVAAFAVCLGMLALERHHPPSLIRTATLQEA
jgi:Na+-translocating ferredoxin:NAD+ oxidoreductase RnfD subunit